MGVMNRDELREALGESLYNHRLGHVDEPIDREDFLWRDSLEVADALLAGPVGDLLAENEGLLYDRRNFRAECDRLRATLDALRELADQHRDWQSGRALHGALRLILNGADGGDRDE